MNQMYLESRVRELKQKLEIEKVFIKKLIYKDHIERLQSELDRNILFKIAKDPGDQEGKNKNSI